MTAWYVHLSGAGEGKYTTEGPSRKYVDMGRLETQVLCFVCAVAPACSLVSQYAPVPIIVPVQLALRRRGYLLRRTLNGCYRCGAITVLDAA